jgi:hypothetical protein
MRPPSIDVTRPGGFAHDVISVGEVSKMIHETNETRENDYH